MSCQPTQQAFPEEIDIPALREKYRQERDKRIIRAATDQYERPIGDFADTYEGDPHMPAFERLLQEWRETGKMDGLVLSGAIAG